MNGDSVNDESASRSLATIENLLKLIAAVLAVLPSAVALLDFIILPKDIAGLLTVLLGVVGTLVFIVILLASDWIARRSWIAIVATCLALGAGGIWAAIEFREFANSNLIEMGTEGMSQDEIERIVIPVKASEELRKLVEPFKGDYVDALHRSVRKTRIRTLINQQNGSAERQLMLLLLLTHGLITGALILGLLRVARAVR